MHFLGINALAVLTAAVVQWVLGWIWYGMLFKKDWTAMVVKDSSKASSAGGVMALIFIANLILSFALVKIIGLYPPPD
jgi:tellurite resistance protein TehA-like permease